MTKIQEFSLKSMLTSEKDKDMLHIEVRSVRFKEECYYKHFQFKDFTESIRFVFQNITKIYIYLQKKDLVYFDQQYGTVNLCIQIAGQMKQFPIALDKKQKANIFMQKKKVYEQQNKKLEDEIQNLKQSKQNQLQTIQNQILSKNQQLIIQCSKINLLNQSIKGIQEQILQLRKQCQQKMNLIRKLNPQQQKEITIQKQAQHLQSTRRFWIQQTRKIKGQKLSALKTYINDQTKFDKQKRLQLKSIQLKKMQIVEVFNKLQILNLSKNKIKQIQGLSSLKYLLKLNLSQNHITLITGLQNNFRLVQLIINKNQIKVIANIFHLSQLQVLSLNQNQIEDVPKQIAKFHKLIELQLIDNKIVHISRKIQSLKNLKIFFINGNKCYKENSKGKEIINRLMRNQIKTAFTHSLSLKP